MNPLLVTVCLVASLALPKESFGCIGMPQGFDASADALIDRSSKIVLARAVAAELPSQTPDYDDIPIRYKFVLLETLAGSVAREFEITGTPPLFPFEVSDFKGHSADEFWKTGGRVMFYPDCEFHPSFAIGRTYLMFLDKPYHSKSFELIRVPPSEPERDKWLQYVKSRLKMKLKRP